MKVIISTVGTSVLRNAADPGEARVLSGYRHEQEKEQAKRLDKLYEELVQKAQADTFDPVRFSAETNSLSRMNLKPGDRLEFLVSDSLDGLLCGKVLKKICRDKWNVETEVRVIEGLQVSSAEDFRARGLNNLIEEVTHILNRYPPEAFEVILNPTGGFKAVVPYITLMGLLHAIPVKYIYEFSNSLIQLPSAPLSLNTDSLGKLGLHAVRLIASDYLSVDELCRITGRSEYQLKKEFSDILVFEDGLATLTALARLLYFREMYREGQDEIAVSRTIRKKIRQNPSWKQYLDEIFTRMRNPLFRLHHLHNEIQNDRIDLDCLKRRRTSERIFFFTEGSTVYLCDIFPHDEYMRLLKEGTVLKRDYLNDFDVPVPVKKA